MTGMVTASWIASIVEGSLIRATPPSRRMSAGTRSSAITATAPASSAIRASSGVTTSMITPPFSISARPRLTRNVARSLIRSRIRERDARPDAHNQRVNDRSGAGAGPLLRKPGCCAGFVPVGEVLHSHDLPVTEGRDLVVELLVDLHSASPAAAVMAKPGRHAVARID